MGLDKCLRICYPVSPLSILNLLRNLSIMNLSAKTHIKLGKLFSLISQFGLDLATWANSMQRQQINLAQAKLQAKINAMNGVK